MMVLLIVYHCPPLQLLHMPYSERAADTARSVQITMLGNSTQNRKTRGRRETAVGPEL